MEKAEILAGDVVRQTMFWYTLEYEKELRESKEDDASQIRKPVKNV